MTNLFLPKHIAERFQKVRVHNDEKEMKVDLIINGALVCKMPIQQAKEVGKALNQQANKLQEIINREQIIFDQAMLSRSGAKFGLITDPRLKLPAIKEALYNSKLKRWLFGRSKGMGNIQSKGIVGAPALHRHKPTPEQRQKQIDYDRSLITGG